MDGSEGRGVSRRREGAEIWKVEEGGGSFERACDSIWLR